MDAWARWLLEDRFGGDPSRREEMLRQLAPVRDRVLDGAALQGGETLLDVGTGDGLIGFGALERLGPDGQVVFSDVSRDLLDVTRRIADEAGVAARCRFVEADAEHLEAIEDASVDVLTTRSVLIYVDDKLAALRQFRRVLRPGGRISLFEPINRTARRLSGATAGGNGALFGYDSRGVAELAGKVSAVFTAAVGGDDAAMLGFDGADLVTTADRAGFERIEAEIVISQRFRAYLGPTDWETLLAFRPNPRAPTAGEAIREALTDEEADRLRAHLEPQVEVGTGRYFMVGCFIRAAAPSPTGEPTAPKT